MTTLCIVDLLKTRIQQVEGSLPKHRYVLQLLRLRAIHLRAITVLCRNNALIVRTVRDIVNTNGILGLWRGTTATLLR